MRTNSEDGGEERGKREKEGRRRKRRINIERSLLPSLPRQGGGAVLNRSKNDTDNTTIYS